MSRALLFSALAASVPDGPPPIERGASPMRSLRRVTPKKPEPKGPLSVRCDRCGAPPGEPCDRRTLGAHDYHGIRVKAAIL